MRGGLGGFEGVVDGGEEVLGVWMEWVSEVVRNIDSYWAGGGLP